MKVAIVHYWLVTMRGGEKVIEELCRLFPGSDIYTHAYRKEGISDVINAHDIKTTFINDLPFARKHYQNYLPLMPLALEQLNLDAYDLVISSESGPAKGILTRPDALHICYCHSPMRYVWSNYHEYRQRANRMTRLCMPMLMHRLRLWDLASAGRVDQFISNSHNVADRVEKYYHRKSTVIHPPVDVDGFHANEERQGFYLFVSQLVRYKRADLIIETFNRLGKPLVVVGQGEELNRLRKLAGPNIQFTGYLDDAALRLQYARCRALIFAADEDFGMVPVEAMSSGTPVIAYRRGGTLETVIPDKTGVFFDEQTPEAVAGAVARFELIEHLFEREHIIRHAQKFSREVFRRRMTDTIDGWMHARALERLRAHSRRTGSDIEHLDPMATTSGRWGEEASEARDSGRLILPRD